MDEEKSRLEQFKEFVEMDPTDLFSRYALAMEYVGAGQYEDAVRHFKEAIRLDPGYSAAYFQAGLASHKAGNIDAAKEFLQNGIVVADKKGDRHARDEMQAALDLLG